MSRLGPRPVVALVALALTGLTTAGAGLVVASCVELGLDVRLGDHLPGGGPWRVAPSCALAGVLMSMMLVRPIRARPWRAAALALAASLAVGLAGFTVAAGQVTIIEFSPDRFEARTHTYHAIPCVWWRITPERTTYHLQEVSAYLVEHGLLTPPSRADARWFFSRGYRYDVRGWHNTARSLERALHPRCTAWSKANPHAASLMWPEVVRAAQSGDLSRAAWLVQWRGSPPWPR